METKKASVTQLVTHGQPGQGTSFPGASGVSIRKARVGLLVSPVGPPKVDWPLRTWIGFFGPPTF